MGYFLWFWFHVIKQAVTIFFKRKLETRRAYRFLKLIEKQLNGEFSPVTKNKIAISYGIYLPMICDTFAHLRNHRISKGEKVRFIYYFICSSLFDDFIDDQLLNNKQLYDLSFHSNRYHANTFEEKAYLLGHLFLRKQVKDKWAYDKVCLNLFEAQVQSQKQFQNKLKHEELKEVTFAKGGYSVLLCSFLFDYQPVKEEQRCWYQAGKLIQLTNDLYDIYKDLQEDIATLPNRMDNARLFESFFDFEINKMKEQISQLPFRNKLKKRFGLSMAGVYAFGLIAIHQLKKIQGTSENLPNFKLLPRRKLIVDMEKRSNLRLWFRFVYRHARLLEKT